MKTRRRLEQGITGATVAIVVLVILLIIFGAFGVWSYLQYTEQKTDVDGKIAVAEGKAKLAQAKKDEADFAKREQQPMRQFVGPSDYGRLTFDYPKTWSAFQATDVSKGGGVKYEAYLNPIVIPPLSDTTKFALRITIEQKTYDTTLASYDKQIKKQELKSSPYSDGGVTGTKIEGNFNKELIGTAIVIKMRDRTLTMRTDGDVFKEDFLALMKTVKFNE